MQRLDTLEFETLINEDDDDEPGQRPYFAAPLRGGGEAEAPVVVGAAGARGVTVTLFKSLLLVAVALQATAYTIVRRLSRGVNEESYSSASVLLVMELIKFSFSLLVVTFEREFSVFTLITTSLPLLLPAIAYLAMNVLSFIAIKHVDATTFIVIIQLKLLTTALFSICIMGKEVSPRRWRSLVTLTVGVTLIAFPSTSIGEPAAAWPGRGRSVSPRDETFYLGVAAVLIEVVLSGFTSVFFESTLKSSRMSVWGRNVQLSSWSILIYAGTVSMEANAADAIFEGWTPLAVACALLGALGGILVALALRFTDSLSKTIATTSCIILTCIGNSLLLGEPVTFHVLLYVVIVVISVIDYVYGAA